VRDEPFCRRISVRGSSISLLTAGDNSITIHGAVSEIRVGWTANPFRRSPTPSSPTFGHGSPTPGQR
jgi:hypothetical protein